MWVQIMLEIDKKSDRKTFAASIYLFLYAYLSQCLVCFNEKNGREKIENKGFRDIEIRVFNLL